MITPPLGQDEHLDNCAKQARRLNEAILSAATDGVAVRMRHFIDDTGILGVVAGQNVRIAELTSEERDETRAL